MISVQTHIQDVDIESKHEFYLIRVVNAGKTKTQGCRRTSMIVAGDREAFSEQILTKADMLTNKRARR